MIELATLSTPRLTLTPLTVDDVEGMLSVAHQGNGYAAEAARTIVDWLASSGVGRIAAAIHPDHRASANVARRAGLTPTTKVVDGEVVWERLVSSF